MKKQNYRIIENDDEINLQVLFGTLWTDRRRIVFISIFITIIGIVYSLMLTPLYKSTITMYPSSQESGGQLGKLQGMASSLGFNVGNSEPSFHILDIVNSRRIKRKLIYNEWSTNSFKSNVNLIKYWGIDDSIKKNIFNPIGHLKRYFFSSKEISKSVLLKTMEISALNKLNSRIDVKKSKTGLITINVLMEEADLSSDIANFMYPLIVDFAIESHAKQARLNREFIDDRQAQIKSELKVAEERLKDFLERNRNILESPNLQLERDRFLREVELKNQVYITLQQQYELARIDEVKITPFVTILDIAKPSVFKEKPKRKIIVLSFLIFGLLFSFSFTLINHAIKIN